MTIASPVFWPIPSSVCAHAHARAAPVRSSVYDTADCNHNYCNTYTDKAVTHPTCWGGSEIGGEREREREGEREGQREGGRGRERKGWERGGERGGEREGERERGRERERESEGERGGKERGREERPNNRIVTND